MRIRTLLVSQLILVSFFSIALPGQKLATLTMNAGGQLRINSTVCAEINGLALGLEHFDLELREWRDGQLVNVPSQMTSGDAVRICWIAEGETAPHDTRIYELWKVPQQIKKRAVITADKDGGIAIKVGDRTALVYQYAKADLPPGVSSEYSRGGFVHPLNTPAGETLTRIQPPDHYHHYGLWNPWTHTEFAGREVDFWNLNKKQGRVDVAALPMRSSGDVFATIKAFHEHVVLSDTLMSQETVALRETLTYRLWKASPADKYYVVDVLSELACAAEEPLVLKEYRYQGFGFRAKADWNDDNVQLLTSEGFNKQDGNATRARWCDIKGPSAAGTSGILFMTTPSNYNFPELLRIWPTGANNGVENVFLNFNPTQDRDWILKPGEAYSLKYRMLIYDGVLKPETAEVHWNDYAHPAKVTVTPVDSLAGKRILVFTKNGKGYVHDNIASSVKAIQKLADANGFQVDVSDSAEIFISPAMAEYDAVIFSNTNNKVFDNERQKIAFQQYIRSGKGFVGIHIATGTERDWPWFAKMIGGRFVRHPVFQEMEVEVIDPNHPSTSFLPKVWVRDDECYFMNQLNPSNHVLLAARLPKIVDEKKADYPGETFGDYCPLAWCHEFDGGRQWYTALGHAIEHYEDPLFMKHILGGIKWVCQPD